MLGEIARLPGRPVREVVVTHDHADHVHGVQALKFAADLGFRGRIPFVGQADSRRWIETLDTLIALRQAVLVPGHGPPSTDPEGDLRLTRDDLVHLRTAMGEAARNLEPFEDAYARTDWSRFAKLPLFGMANRNNAYNIHLQLERESMR